MATRWTMIWLVLVLRVTIRVTSPLGSTQPFSMAYRPTTAEPFPQLLPQSTAASSMPTWAKVYSTSTSPLTGRCRITALLVVEVAPPTPSIWRGSGLPNSRGSSTSRLVPAP